MRRILASALAATLATAQAFPVPAAEAPYYRHNGERAPPRTTLYYPVRAITARASEAQSTAPQSSAVPGPGTFSAPDGLPPGVSLSPSNGTLTVRSTSPASYQPFRVVLTDGSGQAVEALSPAIVVLPQLRLAYPGTLTGVVGARMDASPLVWDGVGGSPRVQILAGSLPDGVDLDPATGHIGGVPRAAGTRTLTFALVHAADGRQVSAGQTTFVVTEPGPLALASVPAPDATLNQAYAFQVGVTGGRAPFAFTVTSGSAPPGTTLSASGSLSGVPTAEGSYALGFRVRDFDGRQADGTLNVAVARQLVVASPTLARATAGQAMPTATFSVANAVGATSWSATGLPGGVALAADGTLSGTPGAAGSYPFTATVVDSRSNSQGAGLTLNVDEPLAAQTPTLPMGATNSVYPSSAQSSGFALTATGGFGTRTWTATGLPSGLSMTSAGRIQGTPRAAGGFTVKATVRDAVGRTASVEAPLQVTAVFAASQASLPKNLVVGTAMSPVTLTTAGGTGSVTWTVASGTPPDNVSLSSTGTVAGTPASPGSYSFTARATDSTGQTADVALTTTVAAAVTLTGPASLPRGTVGQPYPAASDPFVAAGGRTAPTLSASGLPSPLALSGGFVTGTPASPGTYTVTVRAADADNRQASLSRTLVVDGSLSVPQSVLPADVAGTEMAPFGLAVAGGRAPYVWAVDASTLHVGVSMNPSGVVTGTPTSTGTRTYRVSVMDADGRTASGTASHTVDASPTFPALAGAPPDSVPVSTNVDAAAFTASGGQAPYSYAVSSGWMPPGMSIGSDGHVRGSSGYSGTWSFSVRVTDALGRSGDGGPFAMQVTGPYTITGSLPTRAKVGQPYSAQFYVTAAPTSGTFFAYQRTGGSSWGSQTQTVFPGVAIDPATGRVSGTPPAAGTYRSIEIWHKVGSWTGIGPYTVVVDP